MSDFAIACLISGAVLFQLAMNIFQHRIVRRLVRQLSGVQTTIAALQFENLTLRNRLREGTTEQLLNDLR